MKRTYLFLASGLALVIILGLWIAIRLSNPIPPPIRHQINFGLFYPAGSYYQVPRSSVSYNAQTKVVSYKTTIKSSGTTLIINQQATPDSFVDIPQGYDALVEKLQNYASFDSPSGKVYLTHPTELKGGQAAVLNSQGTLLFAQPNKPLTESDWRDLFVALKLIH